MKHLSRLASKTLEFRPHTKPTLKQANMQVLCPSSCSLLARLQAALEMNMSTLTHKVANFNNVTIVKTAMSHRIWGHSRQV